MFRKNTNSPHALISAASELPEKQRKRLENYLAHQDHSHNLRSAVEATVGSVKHPFSAGKLPVRGQFRVTWVAIASAATANVRRIQRYLIAKSSKQKPQKDFKAKLYLPPRFLFLLFPRAAYAPG